MIFVTRQIQARRNDLDTTKIFKTVHILQQTRTYFILWCISIDCERVEDTTDLSSLCLNILESICYIRSFPKLSTCDEMLCEHKENANDHHMELRDDPTALSELKCSSLTPENQPSRATRVFMLFLKEWQYPDDAICADYICFGMPYPLYKTFPTVKTELYPSLNSLVSF